MKISASAKYCLAVLLLFSKISASDAQGLKAGASFRILHAESFAACIGRYRNAETINRKKRRTYGKSSGSR